MKPNIKLSTYLNKYYSYLDTKDAKLEDISEITFHFIKIAEGMIFKQPKIALRAIKVEVLDIYKHHDRYTKEVEQYINELNEIILKGPKLKKQDLERLKVLENQRDMLVEFI